MDMSKYLLEIHIPVETLRLVKRSLRVAFIIPE